MDTKNVEQNLLFALVALKMGLIDEKALIAALNAWSDRKNQTVPSILVEQGALTEARLFVVDATYRELLESVGEQADKALETLRLPAGLLQINHDRVADPAVRAGLGRVEVVSGGPGGDDAALFATHFDPNLATSDPHTRKEDDPFATQFVTDLSAAVRQAQARLEETVDPRGTGAMPTSATIPAPAPSPGEVTEDLYATRPITNASAAIGSPEAPTQPETEDQFATRSVTAPGLAATAEFEASKGRTSGRADTATAPVPPSPIRYRALRPHAKGGLGEVFVALDEELGREVALKEIQGRHADRAESRARFLIEAEVTGGLEHPGIVPVYGLGKYPDGRPYYAMRFIRGRTLKEAIDAYHDADTASRDPGERSLEFRALVRRVIDVCNAMAYAHTRGILHRDIKPANVMLGAFGETLVVDWGLAKAVDRPETLTTESDLRPLKPLSAGQSGTATMYGSTVGTPNFMSPEQAEGDLDRLGPPSDIYSIGAMLYCILVGRPPFHEPQLALLLHKVKRGDFPRPRQVNSQVPAALEAICLKSMALEAEDRYPTARALADDLENWLGDEPVSVYREPWTTRLARWARRHKTLVATSAALVLTALVALSIGTVLIKREQARTEANFQLARDAVDQMLSRLGEVDLADVPQMEPVRKTMLSKALSFYRTFLAEHGNDRSIRQETGRANLRLGDIEEMLGDYTAAEQSYNRAIGLLSALVGDRPRVPEYRRDLASARHKLGVLLKKSNRFTEAESTLGEARRLRKQLVAEFPGNPDDKRDEMDSVYQLGTVLARLGRVKEVEAAYTEAVDAERKLAAEHPESRDYPRQLGRYLNNRGILLRSTSTDPMKAEATFREALDLQKPLSEKSPTVAGLQWERARTTSNLAGVLERTQAPGQAVPLYREALARYKQLADDFPSVPDYQNELAVVATNLGAVLNAQANKSKDKDASAGLLKEASEPLDTAVTIYRQLIQPARFPHRPDYRQRLALAERRSGVLLASRGEDEKADNAFNAAIKDLRELESKYPQVPEYQSDLGVALENLALHQFNHGRSAEALRSINDSIAHQRAAFQANPKHEGFRDFLLGGYNVLQAVLKKQADHAAAAAKADALLRLLPDDPRATLRAARLLDLSATLVATDAALPEAERKDLASARAKLALQQLEKAITDGVPINPLELAPPGFSAIREHSPEKLEALRKSVEAKVKPKVG